VAGFRGRDHAMKLSPNFSAGKGRRVNVHVHVACDQVGNLRGSDSETLFGNGPSVRGWYAANGKRYGPLFRRPRVKYERPSLVAVSPVQLSFTVIESIKSLSRTEPMPTPVKQPAEPDGASQDALNNIDAFACER